MFRIFLPLLHPYIQEDIIFCWDQACNDAFITLKNHLVSSPVFTYPSFEQNATEFVLQIDASAIALGAVLEQQGYASPYLLLHGRQSLSHQLQDQLVYDSLSYHTHIQAKLHDFVHANLTQAASSQKTLIFTTTIQVYLLLIQEIQCSDSKEVRSSMGGGMDYI